MNASARTLVTGLMVAALGLGLPACAAKDATETNDGTAASQVAAGTFETLGDIFSSDTESMMSTFDEQRYVCAFLYEGTWMRAEASLTEGMYDELNEAWAVDMDKVEELLAPLALTTLETIDAPSEEEAGAYVGKTGAELTADGFSFSVGGIVVNGEQTDCTATKDSFEYLVTFDGKVDDEDTDDPAGAVADLVVAQVSIQGPSWEALEG